MSIFDKIFGNKSVPQNQVPSPAPSADQASRQLSSSVVAKEFGEVNVRTKGGQC